MFGLLFSIVFWLYPKAYNIVDYIIFWWTFWVGRYMVVIVRQFVCPAKSPFVLFFSCIFKQRTQDFQLSDVFIFFVVVDLRLDLLLLICGWIC